MTPRTPPTDAELAAWLDEASNPLLPALGVAACAVPVLVAEVRKLRAELHWTRELLADANGDIQCVYGGDPCEDAKRDRPDDWCDECKRTAALDAYRKSKEPTDG